MMAIGAHVRANNFDMLKTRKITKTEEYEVCDLCGKEIDACDGNTLRVGEGEAQRTFIVHMMDENGCVVQLVAKEIDALRKR